MFETWPNGFKCEIQYKDYVAALAIMQQQAGQEKFQLIPKANPYDKRIVEFAIPLMWGILGGKCKGSKNWQARVPYGVRLTVSGFSVHTPEAWITSPTDDKIRHINIFTIDSVRRLRPGGNPYNLPRVCTSRTWDVAWGSLPPEIKNLRSYIFQLWTVLNNENCSDPTDRDP